jgi:hypothetical protein
MFQAPQPDIVMNPLSNFSRPRNKYSPPGSYNRPDSNVEPYQAQHRRNDTADSGVSSLLSRSESPVMRSSSPVSSRTVDSRASRQFVIVTEDSLPKTESKKITESNSVEKEASSPQAGTKKKPVSSTEITAPNSGKKIAEVFPAIRPVDKSKQNRNMNKTASVILDKKANPTDETEAKKKRRHTFSWKRMSGIDHKTDFKNALPAAKEEPAAMNEETSRPKTADESVAEEPTGPTREEKGKGKEVAHDHGPAVIGVKCCDKCGRIRKLQDGRALANSGQPQETLVLAGSSAYRLITTRSDRPGSSAVNPAGAANAAQLIMHRQRRPKPEPPAILPNDHVVKDFAASPPPSIQQESKFVQNQPAKEYPDPPVRLTRFASLHGLSPSNEKEIAPPMPTLNTNLNLDTTKDLPHMKATSTPIDEPLPEFMYDPADDEEEFVEAPTQQRRYSFESQRSVIDVALPEKQEKPREPIGPIDLSKPILLPEPNLGLHFARSNLTLRGLVVEKGGSRTDLLSDTGGKGRGTDEVARGLMASDVMERERKEREARVGEIMAI